MTCGIYVISFCGRSRMYVGQSKNIERRWEEHTTDLEYERHHNVKMRNLWRKFSSTMRFHILEECPLAELNKREQIIIDVLFAEYPNETINILRTVNTVPDRVGRKYSEATKALMRARRISSTNRSPHSQETRSKISAALKGRVLSEEHKLKLSDAKKDKSVKPFSEEHKAKISAANKGRIASNKGKPMSEEQKAKLSIAAKGKTRKPHTDETKDKMSSAAKERWKKKKANSISTVGPK